ncbi:hypothetical protein [Peribacillus simplex]|uniref:hypothetical protein n=1 Tax=Peribacillus simplex TaxID=1478 RepID=UPI001F4FD597|nr:hypothetical protein [Peribacillus simplex]
MQKKIYIVRHCEAQGQPSESPLTEKGLKRHGNIISLLLKNTTIAIFNIRAHIHGHKFPSD